MVEDSLSFHEIDADAESTQVASFLATHVWPFHSKSGLSLDAARNVALGPMENGGITLDSLKAEGRGGSVRARAALNRT